MLLFFGKRGLVPRVFFFLARSAGACPPRSLDLLTSVVRERPLPNGSRAGALVLQRYTVAEFLKKFFHVNDRGGQAPAIR